MTWYAWHRIPIHADWRIRAEGATLDEAHGKLLAEIRNESQESRNRCLTTGAHPDAVRVGGNENGR